MDADATPYNIQFHTLWSWACASNAETTHIIGITDFSWRQLFSRDSYTCEIESKINLFCLTTVMYEIYFINGCYAEA